MTHRLVLLACFAPATLAAQESRAFFDTPVITLDAFDTPYRLALDFDGDGDTDVLGMDKYHDDSSAKAAHELTLHRNGGDGRLPLVWSLGWQDPADRTAPAFVTAGNYLGDAREEVLYTYGTHVHVYQWDQALGAMVEIGTQVNAGQALDATSADFDGDGHANPAVLLADRVQVHVPSASGVQLVDVPIPSGPWTRLLALDVDGDGAAELLLVGPRTFALRSLARRPHSAVRPFGAQLSIEHEMPAVGDLDGDGDQDAVVFGMENYQVLRNTGGVLHVERPVRGGPATGLADIDQDGDLDGVCCSGGDGGPRALPNNAPSKFELSLNDGSGRFARAFEIEAIGSKGLAAVVDLDLDGDVELVAGRVIYYANGPIRAPLAELASEGQDFRNVDRDQDGDPDLGFQAGASSENLADGSTRTRQPRLPALASPLRYGTGSIPGDFDGDGDCDLLVDKWSGSTYLGVFALDNLGGEIFAERGFAFLPGAELTNINLVASEIQVLDIDQDGRLDVMIPGDWDGELRWNDGPAGFSVSAFNELTAAVADMDGDGLLDLVQWLGPIGVRRGLGGRAFGPFQSLTGLTNVTFYPTTDRLAIGDVTGDGAPDIAFINRWSEKLNLLAGTPGTLAMSFVSLAPPAWAYFSDGFLRANRVFAEDLDLDGTLELVAGPQGFDAWPDLRTVVVLERDGTSWNWSRQMGSPRSFLDVDGDGDRDLVGVRVARGRALEGPDAGARLQFGEGLAGLDALAPKLGATGPFRVGETVTLRVACGRGGASATLVSGRTRGDWLQGELPIHVDPADPFYTSTALTLGGAGAGTGTATLSFVVPPSQLGITTYHQVFVDDPAAPGGTSASNGLALTIGALP